MAEPYCLLDAVTGQAINGSVGANTDASRKISVQDTVQRSIHAEATEALERYETQQKLATAAATSSEPVMQEPAPSDKVIARAMSKRAVKFWDWGTKGQQALADTWEKAVTLVNGTSISDATWWTNMQNRVAKWFVNDRNDLVHWLDTIGNMAGRLAYQNPLVQTFAGMIPKIRAMNNIFIDRHQAIMRELEPVASRTGRTVEELFEMGGHYLNYLHMQEGNQHLLQRWRNTVEENTAWLQERTPRIDTLSKTELKEFKRRQKETETLFKQIDNLEANLENPNPPKGLVSRGYTNAQARRLMAELEASSGMTKEELTNIARRISNEYNYITEELAKAGVVEPELLRQLPDFQWYAPQLSRENNLQAVSNDTSYYLANSYHAMEGTSGKVDSAATSLGFFARRAATEIGMQDFGAILRGLYAKHGNKIGLRMVKAHGGDTNNLEGMVIRVPIKQADGTITMDKYQFYFDPNYRLGNITGRQLNDALGSNYKLGNSLIEAMRTATSYYGQSFTRFNPSFAIVGGLRDYMERAAHMVNRAYYKSDGTRIDGSSLVTVFMGNSMRGARMLREAIYGKMEKGSATETFWNEFQREGLLQKYLPDKSYQPQTVAELVKQNSRLSKFLRNEGLGSWADDLDKPQFKEFNRAIEAAKNGGKLALRTLDKWNDSLQNAAAFTHYLTLREAGLTARQAAAGVREMMDMTKAGTVTQYLSIISPFMRPTMQGAQALARTFGLSARKPSEIFQEGKKGWMLAAGAGMAFSALYPMAREWLGQDEAGQYRMDTMSVSRLTSSFPIGIGNKGEYFRVPMGFGPIRLAAAFGICMDRVWRNLMEPSEMAFQVMFAAGRDIAPSNTPGFDFKENPAAYITHMMAPAGLKPFIELGTNINNFGGKIYNDYDPNRANSEQGRKSTPALWHQMARWIHKNGGPDLQPEQYMHFIKSLVHGPLRLVTSTIVDGVSKDSPHQNWETPTAYEQMPGWLKAMGLTLFYGREARTEQHGYYEAKKKITDEVKRLGINMSKTDGLEQKLRDAGMEDDKVREVLLYKEAEQKLRALGSAFTKKWGTWYDTEEADVLRDDFSKLTEDQLVVYVDFLKKVQAL